MDEAEVSRIVGRPDGWVPRRESDHFMLCPVCGEMLDMRRLDQALAHWHNGLMSDDSETNGRARCNHCDGRGKFAGITCEKCGGDGYFLTIPGERPARRLDRTPRTTKKPPPR